MSSSLSLMISPDRPLRFSDKIVKGLPLLLRLHDVKFSLAGAGPATSARTKQAKEKGFRTLKILLNLPVIRRHDSGRCHVNVHLESRHHYHLPKFVGKVVSTR